MPCGDGEADLVVQLGGRGDVAFLLDMKSHAGGPGCNAATIRSESAGDNCLCVRELVTISNSPSRDWVDLPSGDVPLRCRWPSATISLNDMDKISIQFRAFIVPLGVFGANGWFCRVADWAGLLALKMQLLQKRHLGWICPFWIRIWQWVDGTRTPSLGCTLRFLWRLMELLSPNKEAFDLYLRCIRSPAPCRPWSCGGRGQLQFQP